MPRTRVYRDGDVLHDDLPVARAAELIGTPDTAVWIDLGPDDHDELPALAQRLGLHAIAVRDATSAHPRHTYARYDGHDFLTARTTAFDAGKSTLRLASVAAFVTADVLLTVRIVDDGLPDALCARWDAEPELAEHGTGFLLYGLLDEVSRSLSTAVRGLDEALDDLTDGLLATVPDEDAVQRRSLGLRRCLVLVRRTIFPFEDALDSLTAQPEPPYDPTLTPYLRGVREHVSRLSEWTDSLREMVAMIVQTGMALHDSRMTVISKKVSGWAALIAVPAVITGFFGINVPYPGINRLWGFVLCCVVLVASFVALYAVFKRRDWL